MSLRILSRVALNALPRAQASSYLVRPVPTLFQASFRKPSLKCFTGPSFGASISTTVARRQNEELIAKLETELALEEKDRSSGSSELIQDYIKNGPFRVIDTAGEEEVVLERNYNDENIRVTFSVADIANSDVDSEMEVDEDQSLFDEDEPGADDIARGQSGGANSKGSINQGRTGDGNFKVAPEDSVSSADDPEYTDEYGEAREGFATHITVNIDRPKKGSLSVVAEARDGEIMIQGVHYYPESDLANPKTAEKEWEGRALYTGPLYGTLDEDLQVLLEKYLDDRGINTRLALFVPDYIDMKEQKEYMRWLANVKSFME